MRFADDFSKILSSRKGKIKLTILLVLISATSVFAASNIYIVGAGDTLSEIIFKKNLRPVYGKNGYLDKIRELNPKLKNSGDLIYPGDKIILSETITPKVDVDKNNETNNETNNESEINDSNKNTDQLAFVNNNNEKDQAKLILETSVGLNFFRIDGKDMLLSGDAVVLSKANPEFFLGMTLDWDEENKIKTEVGYQYYELQKLNNNRIFTDDSDDRFFISLMYLRRINTKLTLGLGSSFNQDLYFRAINENELDVDQVLIIKPTVSVSYDIFQKSNANIGIYGDVRYLTPTGNSYYDIKSGFGCSLGGYYQYFSQVAPYRAIIFKADYSFEKQDTTLVTQSANGLNFKLGYQWELNW